MRNELLEVVDEDDVVIRTESRGVIHKLGLLHREIHVWFYTTEGEIIFQHRAKDKDTYPDLLDATVGGHVEIGDSYEQTAVNESLEETGTSIDSMEGLHFIKKIKLISEDKVTSTVNYAFKSEYAYLFKGKIQDLMIEKGKSLGFELWSIDVLLSISDEDKKKFIPTIFQTEIIELFRVIKRLV